MDESADSPPHLAGSTSTTPDASNHSISTPIPSVSSSSPSLPQLRSASQPSSPTPVPRLAPISTARIPLAPPLPPPPPPPLTVFNSPTSGATLATPAGSTMPSFVGSLDMLQRAALRQTKWPLVLILPPNPTLTPHMPQPMHAPPAIASSVMLWRRVSTSADAQRYTNFFPVDGLPHLALLDPRSGERLTVWGNEDDPSAMDNNSLAEHVWDAVMDDVAKFLPQHSLDDGKLGPVHRAEKPWAVRTRRVSASASAQQSTAILDDEETAMAAAIAASLADMETESNPNSNQDGGEFDDVEEDDEDLDDGDTSNDMNSTTDVESIALSSSPMLPTAVPTSPVPTPRLGGATSQPTTPMHIAHRMAQPSSVESLSSSYLDRMASCLRSSANPELAERRRLREEQDAELQEALLKDRAKAEASARAEANVRDATARLPSEPVETDATALCIALRLPDGKRLSRRFPPSAKVRALADLVTANNVQVPGAAFSRVANVFSSPGLDLSAATWDMPLAELKLSRRSMFLLQR